MYVMIHINPSFCSKFRWLNVCIFYQIYNFFIFYFIYILHLLIWVHQYVSFFWNAYWFFIKFYIFWQFWRFWCTFNFIYDFISYEITCCFSRFLNCFFWSSCKCICCLLFSKIMNFLTGFTTLILDIILPIFLPVILAKGKTLWPLTHILFLQPVTKYIETTTSCKRFLLPPFNQCWWVCKLHRDYAVDKLLTTTLI